MNTFKEAVNYFSSIAFFLAALGFAGLLISRLF